MAWGRLDDKFHSHRKILRLLDEPDGLAAVGLWTLALSWARDQHKRGETEALIPHGVPRRLSGCDPTLPALLVKVGLWTECADGWMIHDYRDYLPSDAMSSSRAEAGRKGGLASGRARKEASSLKDEASSFEPEASASPLLEAKRSHREASAWGGEGSPSSTGSPTVKGGPGGKPARATRIPADFAVTAEMVAWAKANVPHVDGRVETQKFIDFWTAASGANARKLDWVAAWRLWMRNADERRGQNGRQQLPGMPSVSPHEEHMLRR